MTARRLHLRITRLAQIQAASCPAVGRSCPFVGQAHYPLQRLDSARYRGGMMNRSVRNLATWLCCILLVSVASMTESPSQAVGRVPKISAISVGGIHVCAVTLAGGARCWGGDNVGQATVPRDIGTIQSISAAEYQTCAVTAKHTVRCWGGQGANGPDIPGRSGNVFATAAAIAALACSPIGETMRL